jgi:hypothetical protein
MRLVESWAGSVAILSVHANLQRVGPCKGAADILDAAQIGSGYIDHLSVRLSHTADAEINRPSTTTANPSEYLLMPS